MYCGMNGVGVLLREKHPLQQLHLKKGDGRIFEGELIFGRLRYVSVVCGWVDGHIIE